VVKRNHNAHKLIAEIPYKLLKSQMLPSNQTYKYFDNVFSGENQKMIATELSKTMKRHKEGQQLHNSPTLSGMEFK
jgi:hypothetical protein